MRLIDADKLKTTAVLGLQLQHVKSQYYYFYEEETIQKAPTVEAIPIEWIKWYMQTDGIGYVVIRTMLDWWEKENETDR